MAKLSKRAGRFIGLHIRRHIRLKGMRQKQAVAVAFVEAREKGFRVPPPPSTVKKAKKMGAKC